MNRIKRFVPFFALLALLGLLTTNLAACTVQDGKIYWNATPTPVVVVPAASAAPASAAPASAAPANNDLVSCQVGPVSYRMPADECERAKRDFAAAASAAPRASTAPYSVPPSSAPAPSAAPVAPSAPPVTPVVTTSCIPTAKVAEWAKLPVGDMIIQLNVFFDQNGGNVGKTHEQPNWTLDNPGTAGAAIIWTDTVHKPIVPTNGKPAAENVFRVNTQGSWGGHLVFTSVTVPTPGRFARLCEPISDLKAVFPKAEPQP